MNQSLLLSLGLVWACVALSKCTGDSEGDSGGPRVGFRPSLFGPLQWRLLHMCALNLPRQKSRATDKFRAYLISTAHVLPCKSCRDDFCNLFDRVPVDKFLHHGRIGAIVLMYILHTIVSLKLKKRIPALFEEEEKLLREYSLDVAAAQVPDVLAGLRADFKAAVGLQRLMAEFLEP